MEYMRAKGLAGAARDAADEVLARVGEARAAVLGAPRRLVHKVGLGADGRGGAGSRAPACC